MGESSPGFNRNKNLEVPGAGLIDKGPYSVEFSKEVFKPGNGGCGHRQFRESFGVRDFAEAELEVGWEFEPRGEHAKYRRS